MSACGGSGRRASTSGPTTTLITVDRWTPPAVSGPPSTSAFCTLLVAVYQHVGTLPYAKDLKVREQIVADFVAESPKVVAAAPPSIASDASTYFGTVSEVLSALDKAGLDAAKVKSGQSNADLLSPQMRSATTAVSAFSQNYCHYTIGG